MKHTMKNVWIALCIAYPLVILTSIALTNVLLPLIVLGWILYRKDIDFTKSRVFLWLIAIYLGWTLVCVLLSPYESNWMSWLEERSTFLAILPGLIVGSNERWMRKAVRYMSIYLIIITCYALFQYYFGWDVIRWELIRLSTNNHRAIGLQNSPLTFAGMIGIIAPISAAFYSPVLWRSNMLSLAGVLAVLSSMSRTIMLGFFGWGILLSMLASKRAKLTGVIVIVALIVLPQIIFTSAGERLKHPDETRPYLWRSALSMIQHYPITGVGEDNWNEAFEEYGEEYDAYKTTSHAHNDFLTSMVENGIVGGLLLVVLWAYIVLRMFLAVLKSKGGKRNIYIGFLTAFLVILFGGMFQNFQTDAENALLLWFIVGAGMQYVGISGSNEK